MISVFQDILSDKLSFDKIKVIELASLSDKEEYAFLIEKYVSWQYPETEKGYGNNVFIEYISALSKKTTARRIVWKLKVVNDIIGYLTTSVKFNNCVKFGPFVLKPDFVDSGYTSFFTNYLVNYFQKQGIFKIYATAPSLNYNACGYLLANYFAVEANLKKHYSSTADEVVFGKILNPNSKLKENTLTPLYAYDFKDDDIFNFSLNPYKKFYCNNVFCGAASPKRGGSVKLEITSQNKEHISHFIFKSIEYFLKYDRHKFFSLIPKNNLEVCKILLDFGFVVEGEIITQNNIDNVIVFSFFI